MAWRHQDSSISDIPLFGGYSEEHVALLIEKIVDIRPIHPALLFESGLTKIWAHPELHPCFKDYEGNGNVPSM
jgi:hypothetical protein